MSSQGGLSFYFNSHNQITIAIEELLSIGILFGGLEKADGTISWPPHGDTVMSVMGLDEAMKSSVNALLPSGQQVAVVSLPMLAVLTIFAWSCC